MSYGVKVKVWGDYACFSRPEMKVERVSYDVITPSAARGILEAIYWKPSIKWIVDNIYVNKQIRFTNVRRNELASVISKSNITQAMKGNLKKLEYFIEEDRQQRAAMVLRDVKYVLEAHFEAVTDDGNNHGKHLDIINRRISRGECFHQPYLGTREFSAFFAPADESDINPIKETKDLGWMLYDLDFSSQDGIKPLFFRAYMQNGVIQVPHPDSEEVRG
jgi:CRISPR-associated protein Cas5d